MDNHQQKIQLIIDLCKCCEVPVEKLAQTIGQSQWVIEAIMQGKVTNDVTVASIIGRLLQIYRKKLGYELTEVEKGTLFGRIQLKQWESGQKMNYEKVAMYLDKLEVFNRRKKAAPFTPKEITTTANQKTEKVNDNSNDKTKSSSKKRRSTDWIVYENHVITQKTKGKKRKEKNWNKSRKVALGIMSGKITLPEPPKLYPEPSFLKAAYEKYEKDKRTASAEENDTANLHERFGKLIWDMMHYITHQCKGISLMTRLANRGYSTHDLTSMKDGNYEHTDGYCNVAAYCLYLIGVERAFGKKKWPKNIGISYDNYLSIIYNPSEFEVTTFEMLFVALKNYKPNIVNKNAKREGTDNILDFDSQSHYVRHQSYTSNSNGFDYGITDT